ncbi:hypothetical protein [Pseudalkalibacillus caeni]|uniref:Uncharacterized protein n=1 Tax=Exobacillus caeni TaxID=2574798 RepID=A0A5R9FA87_9BACL|nr:hypothetical protein [Pseudalkalibacillus caeni]TLS37783.1 hypothetical protein FCL54_08150 [Pseudalkalibacillus caeni]
MAEKKKKVIQVDKLIIKANEVVIEGGGNVQDRREARNENMGGPFDFFFGPGPQFQQQPQQGQETGEASEEDPEVPVEGENENQEGNDGGEQGPPGGFSWI